MALQKKFYRQPFKEQVDYFWKKKAVPQEATKKLDKDYHDYSFSVAGLTRADLLEDLRFLVGKAIENGEDYDVFARKFDRLIGRRGWRPNPDPGSPKYAQRVYTIIDTNQRQSHRAGRYQQSQELGSKSPFRFRYWVHRDSPNFRETHKALHMKALEANDPFWDKCLPSCAWGCRCDSYLATESVLKQRGIEILAKAPDPRTIADPEFMHVPGSKKARDGAIAEGRGRLPEDLKDTF
jgi:Phage Mu protein F like protein